jgi:tRNA threonylcarbamoyladenosine biosynthesis protein TsaB
VCVGQVSASTLETPLILSLETATRAGSLALMRGDAGIVSLKAITDESHSVNLLAQIETLLSQAQVSLREIELFATASGPGSFTGLRIGLATIKGFAHTLRRPCIGVPTLHALAHACGVSTKTCALLPAGRGEVFAQLLSVSANGAVSQLSEAEHLPPEMLIEKLSDTRSLRWTGPGAHVYADLIAARARELGIEFVESQAHTVSLDTASLDEAENRWTLVSHEHALAEHVALLALQKLHTGVPREAENLQAIYVRPSDAELNKYV